MNKLQAAEQMRKALQILAATLDDGKAMTVATIYPAYNAGEAYAVGDIVSYGVNGVGDPQLYRVVQAHTSQADWTPNAAVSLYTPIGLTADGVVIWSQPTGAHDAYAKGDVVSYDGVLYESLIDGNVYSPVSYPAGWQRV